MEDRRALIAIGVITVFGSGFALGYAIRGGPGAGEDPPGSDGPSEVAALASDATDASPRDAQLAEGSGGGAVSARAREGPTGSSGARGDVAVIGGGDTSGSAARAGGGGGPGGGSAPGADDGGRPRGRLDASAIRDEVRSHHDELAFCFDWQLHQHPELAGRLTVGFTIGADGRVTEAEIVEDELGDATVLRCLVSVTRRMRFPAPEGGEVTVRYPFQLSHGEEKAGNRAHREATVAGRPPR